MFRAAKKLREAGVLGLNERNAEFIMRLNPRSLYPRVDDKVLTKHLAVQAGMAVPELYGVISNQGQVRNFADIVAPHARGRRFDIVAPGRRRLLARRRPRRLGFAPRRGPTRRLDARAHLQRRQVRLTFLSIPPRPARRGRNPNPDEKKKAPG